MKKIQSIKVIEIKRTFLVAEHIRRYKNKKDYLGKIDRQQLATKLQKAKEKILSLTEEKLDSRISVYPKRLLAFNSCKWYLGTFKPSEVGVWRRAGKLPLEWTNDSLEETAKHVKKAILIKSKKLKSRAKSTINNMIDINTDINQNEKYLLPIVFKGGFGTKGRRRLKKKMVGDIDDGCMRSISLTIMGVKNIKAYLGFPK